MRQSHVAGLLFVALVVHGCSTPANPSPVIDSTARAEVDTNFRSTFDDVVYFEGKSNQGQPFAAYFVTKQTPVLKKSWNPSVSETVVYSKLVFASVWFQEEHFVFEKDQIRPIYNLDPRLSLFTKVYAAVSSGNTLCLSMGGSDGSDSYAVTFIASPDTQAVRVLRSFTDGLDVSRLTHLAQEHLKDLLTNNH